MNSETFFNDTFIRVNDDNLYLTKRKVISRQKSKDGIVTIYDVIDGKDIPLVVTIVEDKDGIFKMMLTLTTTSYTGQVYYFKNR